MEKTGIAKNLKKRKEWANGLTEHDGIRFWTFRPVTKVECFSTFPYLHRMKGL